MGSNPISGFKMAHTVRIYNVSKKHYLFHPWRQYPRGELYRDRVKEEGYSKRDLSNRKRTEDKLELREILFELE